MAQPKKRDYFFDPAGKKVTCFAADVSRCTVSPRLWEAARSNFHDAELQRATDEINEILEVLQQRNKESARHLSFIDVQGRLMLVWTRSGGIVTSASAYDEIVKALKIKSVNRR
jgi:hypothetical protein